MLEGKKVSALLPRSWKKYFVYGFVIPVNKKQKRCNECKGEFLCDDSKNQVNEKEEFETNLNLLGQKTPNQFGHMLPCYKV